MTLHASGPQLQLDETILTRALTTRNILSGREVMTYVSIWVSLADFSGRVQGDHPSEAVDV